MVSSVYIRRVAPLNITQVMKITADSVILALLECGKVIQIIELNRRLKMRLKCRQ